MRAPATAPTPLSRKLGLKPGQHVFWEAIPPDVATRLQAEVDGLVICDAAQDALDMAHIFVAERARLEAALPQVLERILPDGMIWVSWPKKASKVPSDVTEDVVRDVALPMGLVDVKVCAVDTIWSGLKLVIRKELRPAHRANSRKS